MHVWTIYVRQAILVLLLLVVVLLLSLVLLPSAGILQTVSDSF